jgi:hypothetical protein
MVKPADTASIEKFTGRSWPSWMYWLDKHEARKLPHKQIAILVGEKAKVDGWWAQAITVAYEQHIGRRQPGQSVDGTFKVSASRIVEGEPSQLRDRWAKKQAKALSGLAIAASPSTSDTPKRHYWRCGLTDGSKVILSFETKSKGKTLVSLEHSRLAGEGDLKSLKEKWRVNLESL